MQIVSHSAPIGQRQVCATCGQGFVARRRGHHGITRTGIDLGPICKTCFRSQPDQLRERIRRQAYLLRTQPRQVAWVWDGSQTPYRRDEYARLLDDLAKEKRIHYPLLVRISRLFQ